MHKSWFSPESFLTFSRTLTSIDFPQRRSRELKRKFYLGRPLLGFSHCSACLVSYIIMIVTKWGSHRWFDGRINVNSGASNYTKITCAFMIQFSFKVTQLRVWKFHPHWQRRKAFWNIKNDNLLPFARHARLWYIWRRKTRL